MARTTLDIDTPIRNEICRLQQKQGRPMGKIVSELLAPALAEGKQLAPVAFNWRPRPMGVGVNLNDKESLYAILDSSNECVFPLTPADPDG
ncbi:MAG: hypothetical protein WCP07_12475 [bacterium]